MRPEFAKLLKVIRRNTPDANVSLVRKAYRIADQAHIGQKRLSGEPYISHPLAVARILANLKLDVTTITAGLLHDVLEDTSLKRELLQKEFGDTVTRLVDGVTKISTLSVPTVSTVKKTPDDKKSTTAVKPAAVAAIREKQAASVRKMLVATARDVRVLLVKLADRLHNMRTIEFLPPEKIQRISQETLDIYAPLAHRLGIARWKWELEDHAFHRLNPIEYKQIAARVSMKRREREAWLNKTIEFLKQRMADEGFQAEVLGRPKHLYSIYLKMVQQGKDFDEIRDIQAVRIITSKESECYGALGIAHNIWTPIAGRFKDYIATPKSNGYQSIHSTVMCEDGMPLEIQIRTDEMDRVAQEGIAAHWRYKEGDQVGDRKFEENLTWLRQMYEWIQEPHSADDLLEGIRREVQMDIIFVFTPKGEVRELPAGATPLDFAYAIHSDIGNHCIGARVNARMVQISHPLQTGDTVEILTSKNQQPHIDWVDIVVSARARAKIRQRLREQGELERVEQEKPKPEQPRHVQPPKPVIREVDNATRLTLIRIEGEKNMVVQFAKCCNPMPGHRVVGYTTRNVGIMIHRADCRMFNRITPDPKRMVDVSWEGEKQFQAALRVDTTQRSNMLASLTNAIVPLNIVITEAQFQAGLNGQQEFNFVFNASTRRIIDRVVRTVHAVTGVIDVEIRYVHEIVPETSV